MRWTRSRRVTMVLVKEGRGHLSKRCRLTSRFHDKSAVLGDGGSEVIFHVIYYRARNSHLRTNLSMFMDAPQDRGVLVQGPPC